MKNRIANHRRGAVAIAGLLLGTALTVADDDFAIVRWTIDNGGKMWCTGDDFELSGAIGQPDARVSSNGEFELSGGFWFPLAPTDCNEDGSVSLIDYEDFASCLSGPDTDPPPGCKCYDVNRSGTVDLLDFAVAQTAFSGT